MNAYALFSIAITLLEAGKMQEVLQITHDILESHPNSVDALYLRGVAAQNNIERMLSLKAALSIDPQHQQASHLLNRLIMNAENPLETLQQLDIWHQSLEVTTLFFGIDLYIQGEYLTAIQILNDINKYTKTISAALFTIASCYICLGQLSQASSYLQKAIDSKDPYPEAIIMRKIVQLLILKEYQNK